MRLLQFMTEATSTDLATSHLSCCVVAMWHSVAVHLLQPTEGAVKSLHLQSLGNWCNKIARLNLVSISNVTGGIELIGMSKKDTLIGWKEGKMLVSHWPRPCRCWEGKEWNLKPFSTFLIREQSNAALGDYKWLRISAFDRAGFWLGYHEDEMAKMYTS